VTPQNGWTVTLYGDDSVVRPQDSDVAVQFVYLDPQVNPHPSPPPFGFTLPPGSFWPQRPPPLCECCWEALGLLLGRRSRSFGKTGSQATLQVGSPSRTNARQSFAISLSASMSPALTSPSPSAGSSTS
jgi:hypothetical protein